MAGGGEERELTLGTLITPGNMLMGCDGPRVELCPDSCRRACCTCLGIFKLNFVGIRDSDKRLFI